MENKKYTQTDIYTAIANYAQEVGDINEIPSAVVIEFCEKKLAQLETKSSKVDTKKAKAHEAIMDAIRDVLSECKNAIGMQCGAIYKDERVSAVANSSQQVSAILAKMIVAGDVVKTSEKKVSFFKLV